LDETTAAPVSASSIGAAVATPSEAADDSTSSIWFVVVAGSFTKSEPELSVATPVGISFETCFCAAMLVDPFACSAPTATSVVWSLVSLSEFSGDVTLSSTAGAVDISSSTATGSIDFVESNEAVDVVGPFFRDDGRDCSLR